MSVFEFNNRPFLLNANKVSKREQQIYNLLVDTSLLYPYEIETPNGEHTTKWRHLSIDDAKALLEETDKRPLVDRIDWSDILESSLQEYNTSIEIKRVAPVVHFSILLL